MKITYHKDTPNEVEVEYKERDIYLTAPNKLLERIKITPSKKNGQIYHVMFENNLKVPNGFEGGFTDVGTLVHKLVANIVNRKPTKAKAVKDNWEKNHGSVPTEQGS